MLYPINQSVTLFTRLEDIFSFMEKHFKELSVLFSSTNTEQNIAKCRNAMRLLAERSQTELSYVKSYVKS